MQINRNEKTILGFALLLSLICFIYLSVQNTASLEDPNAFIENTTEALNDNNTYSEEYSTPDIKYLNRVLDQIKYLSFR